MATFQEIIQQLTNIQEEVRVVNALRGVVADSLGSSEEDDQCLLLLNSKELLVRPSTLASVLQTLDQALSEYNSRLDRIQSLEVVDPDERESDEDE